MTKPEILVIEDDQDDVDLLARFLEKNGVAVTLRVASNAKEAIAALESRQHSLPALVLVDLGLPLVSGQQVIQMIRARVAWRTLPIFVLTGSRNKPELDACITLGAAAYFVKPRRWHDYHEFIRAVRRYVDSGADTVACAAVDWGGKEAEERLAHEVEAALRAFSPEDRQIVRIGLKNAYLKPQHVLHVLQEQRILADRGIEHSVWFLLQELAILNDAEARKLRSLCSSQSVRALAIEGFVLEGKLGSGGMGTVFRARHADGREAAVKILSPNCAKDREFALRFAIEAKVGALLRHAHIARLLSSGETDGLHYLIVELVRGRDLQSYVTENGPMPESAAIQLFAQLAQALGYAWSHGVVHRDVKPSNIMIGPARTGKCEPFCAKLCDFGLAKGINPHHTLALDLPIGGLTRLGTTVGTPHFMSPEQARGEKVDFRTDIYALAATLHYAMTGKTLYTGKGSAMIMRQQVAAPADLSSLSHHRIRPSLIDLLRSMLAKDRAQRPSWDRIIERLRVDAPEIVAVTDLDSGTHNYAVTSRPWPPPSASSEADSRTRPRRGPHKP